ncbi:MAG: M23 family metallopeptidase [Nitrospina sp.]|nr:M23 family metallopeptidase [Nitrospina sp.]MBT7179988.1 M23 family metallopeptidase [Nitrospina sp.]
MPCHHYLKSAFFIGFLFLIGCQSFQYDPWPDTGEGVYHTVQKGQTLYRIAKTYELDVKVLQRANHIGDPSKLKEGTRLWIPGARRVLQIPDKPHPHTAKKKTSPTVKPRKGFFIWPTKGTLTSRFGMRNGRKHEGIDIAAPKGTPVHSAADGNVVFSGWGPTGYGKMVIIKHKHHLTTLYAHNSKLLVKKGSRVKQGQRISLMGNTGRSTGPHLHFEVRNDTHPKDPIKYLSVKR